MDETGYIETLFQSYKNDLMLNSGLSYAAAAAGALNNMKSGATAIFGVNEQYNPYNY